MKNKWKVSTKILLLALFSCIWLVYLLDLIIDLESIWKIAVAIILSALFYSFFGWLIGIVKRYLNIFDNFLDNTSIELLLGGTTGLLMGIIVGLLGGYPFSVISSAGKYLTIAVFFFSAYMGLKIGTRRASDIYGILPFNASENTEYDDAPVNESHSKVVDTSAIIDGRIYDVCLSNFLEGSLIVPVFVIDELQHIADSSDSMRRNKGRHGLELLSKMQKHPRIKLDIMDTSIVEEKEVDAKLIRLCKELNASIITNDYNLNKVAELQGIQVLNINELINAVKVIVYPGESMTISIIKAGKEEGQGVGYLEDGTMVVVENAHDEIGRDLEVMVTSVFQTAAGRMIFSRKIKEEKHGDAKNNLQDVQEVNLFA